MSTTTLIQTGYDNSLWSPVLWDDQGNPVSVAGAVPAPAALNYATVYRYPGRVFPYRSDEALRDSPYNALSMRRRAFYARLMQERVAPTVNRKWQVKVKDPDDPQQKLVMDGVQESWENTPDRTGLVQWLMEAVWFGRSGSQVVWDRQANGKPGVVYHEPVHGDGILFTWDGCPVILCNKFSADRYAQQGVSQNDILPPAKLEPVVIGATDRGAWGIVLRQTPLRRRFIVHKHQREAADYYEGDLSGSLHGSGLRGKAYWTDQMLINSEQGMMNFLFSTGMMDLLVFNYLGGNKESHDRASQNADKITGKVTILNPCLAPDLARLGPVTQIPMNTGGVKALQEVIQEHFGKQLEHLFVGQSMSTGEDGTGSLGGSGRAEFAESTKTEILKTDTNRLGETLSTDWAVPARDFLFPGSTVQVWMEPVVQDQDKDGKQLDAAVKILPFVAIEEDELREKAGFRKPREGRRTVGGQQAAPLGAPGANGLNPALPAGHAPGESPKPPGDPQDDPAKPNPVLPAGDPAPDPAATPNPTLPAGQPASAGLVAGGDAGPKPTDDETANAIAELIGILNESIGLEPTANRDAIFAAVKEHTAGATPYALDRAKDGRFGHVAGEHKGPDAGTDRAATPSTDTSPAGQPSSRDHENGDPLADLGADHADELADQRTAEAARSFFGRVKDKVNEWAVRVSPYILPVAEAILDTPEDMQRFGYCPTVTGPTATADAASGGDPLKAATGISTHLALSIASKVLAAVFVKGKRIAGYQLPDGTIILYAIEG